MTPMTMPRRHPTSLLLAACAWLVLGCGAGRGAGCHGPGPRAVRIDAGAGADARAATLDAATPDAAAPALVRGVTRGAFIEVQEGDYFHIVIRDQAGGLQSFFIAPALPASAWEPFLTRRHRGKTVEIAWEQVTLYIPEAGSEETIRRATGIRLLE
jgi:hypothetical protein